MVAGDGRTHENRDACSGGAGYQPHHCSRSRQRYGPGLQQVFPAQRWFLLQSIGLPTGFVQVYVEWPSDHVPVRAGSRDCSGFDKSQAVYGRIRTLVRTLIPEWPARDLLRDLASVARTSIMRLSRLGRMGCSLGTTNDLDSQHRDREVPVSVGRQTTIPSITRGECKRGGGRACTKWEPSS